MRITKRSVCKYNTVRAKITSFTPHTRAAQASTSIPSAGSGLLVGLRLTYLPLLPAALPADGLRDTYRPSLPATLPLRLRLLPRSGSLSSSEPSV
jgi:hypothetical protein